MSTISIVIGEKYYNKDPQSSDLGRSIVSSSIALLDDLGFEQFTFKKLAEHIHSTEASIYRYFDNKLKLLVYLTTWYWAWVEYLIDFRTHHITDSQEKMNEIIRIVCHLDADHSLIDLSGVDISILRKVVGNESDKTYLTKQVDEINNQGLFMGYKGLCRKIAAVVSEVNPSYQYPHAIVSTLLEATHQQVFFARHLPSLTDVKNHDDEPPLDQQVYEFIKDTVLRVLA